MRKVVCIVFIKNKKVLLVNKRGIYILPGGKPKKNENDMECLEREVNEELNADITSLPISFLGEFRGCAPYKKYEFFSKVYFCECDNRKAFREIRAQAEISNFIWTKKPLAHKLSEVTIKIINFLLEKKIM